MKKNRYDGITVIIPGYGDKGTIFNSISSVFNQTLGKRDYKVEIIYYDDSLGECGYDSVEDLLKNLSDIKHNPNITYQYIKNEEHLYQGGCRLDGIRRATYSLCILLDCDDMLAPHTVMTYLDTYKKYQNDHKDDKDGLKMLYKIGGNLVSFDHDYRKLISNSIWVQEWAYNSDFFEEFDELYHIYDGHPINRRQGEDYLMCSCADYVFEHNKDKWDAITLKDVEIGFWIPNYNSLSRQDQFYGQHLSGSTMQSSGIIWRFMNEYNKKHNIDNKEDEFMKHKILNMSIYAIHNILDFIKTVSSTDYKPLEEDWYNLSQGVSYLFDELQLYLPEIIYSDIEDEAYRVHHMSDVRFTESWIGNVFDILHKNDDVVKILNMNYDDMMSYAKSLQFDNVGHEIHSPQVIAWTERHKG